MSQELQNGLNCLERALLLNVEILTHLEASELDFEALEHLFEQKEALSVELDGLTKRIFSGALLSPGMSEEGSILRAAYQVALLQCAQSEHRVSEKVASLGSPQRLLIYIAPKKSSPNFDQSI